MKHLSTIVEYIIYYIYDSVKTKISLSLYFVDIILNFIDIIFSITRNKNINISIIINVTFVTSICDSNI